MQPLLSLNKLTRVFTRRQGLFAAKRDFFAVNRVCLDLFPGETLGLVGESGCGKSTLARMAVRLLPPTSGDVIFRGASLYHPSPGGGMRGQQEKTLCRSLQMIFQDPFSSLNPRMRVGESVAEPLRCAGGVASAREREKIAADMLERVGLGPEALHRYPHEFSGGQRQRIAIARALATRPELVVCDEPTSSLDSSVQAQVLNLLVEFQEQFGLSYLFITHDLAIVRHMSDRVAVMHAGLIVEEGATAAVFAAPRHPYTRLLLDSEPDFLKEAPGVRPARNRGETEDNGPARPDAGTPQTAAPRTLWPDAGCLFAPRCPRQIAHCARVVPELVAEGNPVRRIRCHNPL